MKTRKAGVITSIVLVFIVLFLAIGSGYFLYKPDKFTLKSPFGVLNIIRGNVQVMTRDALTWKNAVNGMTLEPGSRVKTAPDASAMVAFASGTTSKLEPGTDLIIDRIQQNQDTQAFAVILKQQSGKTWNQVDKEGGKANFQIRTSSSEVTVHGTLFSAEVDKTGETTVQTAEGLVSVSAGGSEVQVPPGMQTQVKQGEKPSVPMALPQAKNELVITVNQPVYGLVKDPSGSSTGYNSAGTKINQISGSTVSGGQISLREAEPGDYTLTLRGTTDGSAEISVQGLVGGKSSFLHIESCNFTAAKDTLLKLHYNVIDGLLQRDDSPGQSLAVAGVAAAASALKETQSDSKTTNIKPAPASATKPPAAVAKKVASPGKGLTWLGADKNTQLGRLVSVACFLFLVLVIFIFMRRKNE